MKAHRFDRIAHFLATRRADRTIVASAQEATPAAEVYDPTRKTNYLFVQSFEGGTVAPKEGEPDTYTLTLQHGLGQTIYFSDRPERNVGAVPTAAFLDGLGFPAEIPPNAALVVETASDQTNIAVLELFNPVYDEANQTATYDVQILEEWERSLDLGLSETPANLAAITASFGTAHLFIDDCITWKVRCLTQGVQGQEVFHWDNVPYCWHPFVGCLPCEPYGDQQLVSSQWVVDYWTNRCNTEITACVDDGRRGLGCRADFLF